MNKTRIEWTDRTLNPVVGCSHNCPFCYARRIAKRHLLICKVCWTFEPHPHLERLCQLTPYQRPRRIFIDSMWDWNDAKVKDEWLLQILNKMLDCPQHTFQILSKRPKRYYRFPYPQNVWLGASVCNNSDTYRIHDLIDGDPKEHIHFLSLEPLHEKLDFWFSKVDWIIIGAETGRRFGRIEPEREWISCIVENCKAENIPVFMKGNLKPFWDADLIQQFPFMNVAKAVAL